MKFNMKIFQYKILTLLVAAVVLGACEKDTEGVSRTTFYPIITLNGEDEVFIEKNEAYTEPGGVALEGDSEIELDVNYSGTYFTGAIPSINTAVADKYTASYVAINKDGFPGLAARTVYVAGKGDLVNSIEGLYTSTVVRNNASGPQYTNMGYVIISKVDEETYAISDGIGGYYDLGRAYGPDYAAVGATVTANNIASDDFTFGPSFGVGAFGGEAVITSMEVDAAAKTVKFVTEWDGGPYTFVITLKQVQF
jgi:Domain of unknown function (DUF5011)/Domain of unknown function (DUF5012)